jgi:putative membrane protein
LLGYAAAVAHALLTRGWRVAAVLVGVTTGGGFAVEALGVASGFPFGAYGYSRALGPLVAGVPLVIPLAWTWMAWPAWLASGRLAAGRPAARVVVAGWALAAWDLFLDPQMVAEGYWHWRHPSPALPGVPTVPLSNYAGWFAVGVLLMALLSALGGPPARACRAEDAPMLALYLWTYASSVLAHAVFLDLPASAAWGGLGMGPVALPLAYRLLRR